jgi:hypothetical protein
MRQQRFPTPATRVSGSRVFTAASATSPSPSFGRAVTVPSAFASWGRGVLRAMSRRSRSSRCLRRVRRARPGHERLSFAYVARWSDGFVELVKDTTERVVECQKRILDGVDDVPVGGYTAMVGD